ncbi:MAG: hypothetical protein Q9201_005573 [Fulgogasparrea decipioides]
MRKCGIETQRRRHYTPAQHLGLKPKVQKTNCSLAIALTNTFLEIKAPQEHRILASQDVLQGIEQFFWPGRYHHIIDGNHQRFLDGAHNNLSIQKAAQWFVKTTWEGQGYLVMSDPSNTKLRAEGFSEFPPGTRILVFSHISERDVAALLKGVAEALNRGGLQIQHEHMKNGKMVLSAWVQVIDDFYIVSSELIFNPDHCLKPPEKPFSVDLQKDYIEAYRIIDPSVGISVKPTIEGALNLAKDNGRRDNGMQTLVTGSLF